MRKEEKKIGKNIHENAAKMQKSIVRDWLRAWKLDVLTLEPPFQTDTPLILSIALHISNLQHFFFCLLHA